MSAPLPPALALRGIAKRFGSVQALRGADFALMRGELHALLGENGAGKTTLMHVAFGLVHPDRGNVSLDGHDHAIGSPRTARRLGIGMVHQHFTSIPALTVAENVALAAGWPVAPGALGARVRELGERVGLPLDPDARAETLSVSLKQRLEIVKALAADVRVLILDEPTAVLALSEAEELLRVVRAFTRRGGAAVLITHKLDEALAAADSVTVLRRGLVVRHGPIAGESPDSLAHAMIGDEPPGAAAEVGPRTADTGAVLVRLEELEIPRESGYGIAVRRATLSVRPGEIVGVAGVEGNGQRELLRAIAGRLHPLRGRREVAGPVAYVPEDRTTEGLIPELTLTENLVLGSRPDDGWIRGWRVDWRLARSRTASLLQEYDVSAPGPDARAAELSGGNQQKVVLARELARAPRVVVAENPTRGLDIRASAAIHARLRQAARDGAAVVLSSTDLDELLALADRILVASRGTLLDMPPGTSRAAIGAAMVAGER